MVDYVLTVAVSVAAGVAAITSALPEWHVNRVEMTLGFVLILMVGNLRGIRESGRVFSIPTYFFIVSLLALIAVGAWRVLNGAAQPLIAEDPIHPAGATLTLFLLLTAFSNGCTAMTGVEAVSNGVPVFKPPESKNAAATMLMMAVLSITMFLGITLLAQAYTSPRARARRSCRSSRAGCLADEGRPTTSCRRRPCSFWCWPPTRRTPIFHAWVPFSPATDTSRASS
jgi:amino acid transporter